MPQTPAIFFDHVSKRFAAGARPAVDNITLEVPSGDLVVLLGPSGCGKTTLLKMVNRLYEHDSGRVLIEGREIRSFKINDLRRRIGYVIQSTGLFPHMTVAKNIAIVPEMLGWDKERISNRVDELLELVGLSPKEYCDRYPLQLSGGQQQRVGLARAMAADPSIMLMDEPFAAIDNITRRRLQDELLDIQGKVRKTILFVTHDVEEALRLADRIAVMHQGTIVQYDTPLNILSSPADEFVAELVGAGDVLRQLGLLTVQSVMTPPDAEGSKPELGEVQEPAEGSGHALSPNDDLRKALGLLLSAGTDAILVLDEQGKNVGVVTLAGIEGVIQRPRSQVSSPMSHVP